MQIRAAQIKRRASALNVHTVFLDIHNVALNVHTVTLIVHAIASPAQTNGHPVDSEVIVEWDQDVLFEKCQLARAEKLEPIPAQYLTGDRDVDAPEYSPLIWVSTLAVTPSVVVDAPEYSPLIWVSTLAVTPSVVVDAPKYSPSSVLRFRTVRRFLLSVSEKYAKCSGGKWSSLVVEGIIGLNKSLLTAGRLALSAFLCGTLDTVGDLEGDIAQYCCNAPLPRRCVCKAQWEYAGQSFNGCANPDIDVLGPWYAFVFRVTTTSWGPGTPSSLGLEGVIR
eukprot:1195376-Prorocentrum_minimum.AAC.4